MSNPNARSRENRVLVVGGAGYVGGIVTDLLQDDLFNVTVYDVLAYEERFLKDVDFVYGDVRDREKLRKLLPQFDTVVWLAAIVGDGACAADPWLTQDVNEDSVRWLADPDNFKGRIVFTSTCSVYGVNNDLIDETATPKPLSVYAETKLRAEQYLLEVAGDRSLVFRLGTLFGLGDHFSRIRLDLVVNVLAMKAAMGQKLTVFGGEQWRPLIHVRDVGRAILRGLDDDIYGMYNLSSGNVQIHEIADRIQDLLPSCEVEKVDMLFEDQRNYRVSSEAWQQVSHDWEPRYSLLDGIHEVVELIQSDRIKNPGSPIYSNEAHINECYRRWL